MPKGKFLNHKGRNRKFTSPEELEEQRKQDEEKQRRKHQKGGDDSESEEEGGEDKESGSEEEDSSEDEPGKSKGVAGLIEVENPNRVVKKSKKLSTLNETVGGTEVKPELSRREREELKRQRGAAAYQKLHAAGATDEARADLARLALVRQQREEAAKRREMEKVNKEASQKTNQKTNARFLSKKQSEKT